MSNTIVKLRINQRGQGFTLEKAQFRDLLEPYMVKDIAYFTDAKRLYYSIVANYNFEKLSALKNQCYTLK